jgi:hypothetical protein
VAYERVKPTYKHEVDVIIKEEEDRQYKILHFVDRTSCNDSW